MLITLKHLLRRGKGEQGVGPAGLGQFEHRVVEAAIADYFAAPNT